MDEAYICHVAMGYALNLGFCPTTILNHSHMMPYVYIRIIMISTSLNHLGPTENGLESLY